MIHLHYQESPNLRSVVAAQRCKTLHLFKLAAGCIAFLFLSSGVQAQVDAWASTASIVPRSQAGIRLGHGGTDPSMSARDEARFWRFLQSHQNFDWRQTTVREIARDIAMHVPCWVNATELDLLAISPDIRIDGVPRGKVITQLTIALEPLELTFIVRNGVIEITSRDSAEDEPITRLYDVGPILLPTVNPRTKIRTLSFSSLQRIIFENIEPDSWVINGGTSAIEPLRIPGREFLVISAPTAVQLKVTSLLESLVLSSDPAIAGQRIASGVIEVADKTMLAGGWSRSSNSLPVTSGFSYEQILDRPANRLPRPYLKLNR